MRRRSSGSSDDGDHSPVEAPCVDCSPDLNTPELLRPSAPSQNSTKLNRRPGVDGQPTSAISRRSNNSINWKVSDTSNASIEKTASSAYSTTSSPLSLGPPVDGSPTKEMEKTQESAFAGRRPRLRSPWALTCLTLLVTIVGIGFLAGVLNSSATRQIDPKGCRMSYMRPSYARLDDFDTEHTRFASKYSLYLYREQGIDNDVKVRSDPANELTRFFCFRCLANPYYRSRVFLSSSSPAMLAATSKSDLLRQSRPITSTMSSSKTSLPSRLVPEASIFSRSILTRILPPSTAKPCLTRPST